MVRSFRYALIAAALLSLAEALSLALGAPEGNVVLPPVRSLAVPGWVPSQIVVNSRVTGSVRFIQNYVAPRVGGMAAVESRCSADPKDFLKWSGKLAYLGAGYEQLASTTTTLALPAGAHVEARTASLSRVLMRAASDRVLILYAYVDHWGIHAQTAELWPRAAADLLTRHSGPYCMLGITVTIGTSEAQADAEARELARAFLPVLDRVIHS